MIVVVGWCCCKVCAVVCVARFFFVDVSARCLRVVVRCVWLRLSLAFVVFVFA